MNRRAWLVLVVLTVGWARPVGAQVSLIGDWSSRAHEDPNRNDPLLGDFTGLPITPQALAHGDAWQEGRLTVVERQCVPNGAAWAFRGPAQIRIWEEKDPTTQNVVAIKTFIATFAQTRTIWMDGRPRPGAYAPHTWQGFSTGTWEGGKLTVTTTHLKRFFHRRNGLPQSDRTTLTEQFIRHGNNYLTHITVADDPVYLSEPLVQSQNFVLVSNVQPAAYQTWTVCRAQVEIAGRPEGFVPHYLPGTNPFVDEYSKKFALPVEATRAGAETMYPEYRPALRKLQGVAASSAPASEPRDRAPQRRPPAAAAADVDTDVEIVQVASDVYMVAAASGNITVNVGPQGLFVVDTGSEAMSAKTVAAIRTISDKPIRFIVQTSAHPDRVGGTPALNQLAEAIRSRETIDTGAVILAHENTFNRMSAATGDRAPTPVSAWANSTFFVSRQDEYFNGQGIQLVHRAASTDGDVVVVFRRSDVIAAGDIFDPTRYPAIDLDKGGSIQGEIDAINWLLEVMIPGEKEEAGTMVVGGRGRLCDEGDVSEYRDMLTIVRDRVQDMVTKGMTLDQVKAARPSFEYDPEYGPGDAFVETVYRSLRGRR
jgi:glyoxylase-like metal-dependent hydrolase (beta-lactamase superfamily II)